TASQPLESLLRTLRSKGQVTELALEALNEQETITLATQVAGRTLDQPMTTHLYRETEGNPLFIVETIRMREGVGKEVPGSSGVAHTKGRKSVLVSGRISHSTLQVNCNELTDIRSTNETLFAF
ncbi:MAG: hypothetical protein JOZ18_04315, partial [Chloroflexi bacterium]|nr:hypothetical protein [Chloroflexota bacterium]